ncbi:MAG: aminodeoxychorismate/anthranilate synthase component II [Thermoguttaceae bacterium]|nr:aminodeoxychorismate/anthranilate synthase component II [Thermoguttaceae bacterium]MBR6480603.1 aminodeoxychorismate/anthranilate synthase component II [Thermoguttaceae bacterium]
MTLLIDNYDSFSYNLYQMIGELDPDIKVIRNDELSVEQIADLKPDRIILSPGPGRPSDAGVCKEVVRALSGYIPTLGVCLGHQAICEVFGGTVTYAPKLMHGKQSDAVLDTGSPLFKGLPETIRVGRYHSLAVDPVTLPANLRVIARTAEGEVMAVQYADYPVFGLQFHPESILTPQGKTILRNFMEISQ